MSDETDSSAARTYLRGLNIAVAGNAQAFGFSILITCTFGATVVGQGNPTEGQVMAFALAAVAALSLLNLIVVRFIERRSFSRESTRVVLIATATDFLSVGVGVGAAIGLNHGLTGWAAWVLAPFVAGLAYVVVQAVEMAIGREAS